MSEYKDKAIKKLNDEFDSHKTFGRKGDVIARPIRDVLLTFCEAEEEFAQAVAQTDNTFHDCITTISKSIGNACSDHDVYEAAADFYFKGAKVYMTPTIDLIGDAGKAKPTTSAGFDFDDFF